MGSKKVVWLSDGGKGFWRIFESWLKTAADKVIGILDFYHAAQNLSNVAKSWLDGRTSKCREWFSDVRHKLRHGKENEVISELDNLRKSDELSDEIKQIFHNAYQYLKDHINMILPIF